MKCATPKSKASAYVHEDADVIGKKTKKDTKQDEVELARGLMETRRLRQGEECEFTPQELMWERNKIKNGTSMP